MVPHIGATALELSHFVGEWVQAHLYATKGATPAFAPHWDVIDVLVVQVEGEKHWDVYGPGVQHPIDAATDPGNTCPETAIWSGVLHPGDALYLPRGCFHGVRGTGGTSIHLSYGFQRRTGLTYLSWLTGFARRAAAFREDIPRSGEPEDLARHGKILAEGLAQLARDHPLPAYLAAHTDRVEPPANPGLDRRDGGR
jgi:ribosomal protein L16 Arg81 hydroxylase